MTQNEAVLDALAKRHGEWVSMPDLVQASGAYAIHSRVAELRSEGHVIQNKVEGTKPRRSFYRLVSPIQVSLL